MRAQMLKCSRVLVVRDSKGMMHTAMVINHRIDRRVTLHQDKASPCGIEEHHLPVRRGGQMPAADHVGIELRASRDLADRNAEMSDPSDRNHLASLSPNASSIQIE